MKISCSGGYFSASHFIVFENGFCEPLHGHNFGVEVVIDAPLNAAGYAVDFLEINEALKEILEPWQERLLLPQKNELLSIRCHETQVEISHTQPDGLPLYWSIPVSHCVFLDVVNTTAELLAQTIAQRLWDRLSVKTPLNWLEIHLEETHDSRAICRIPSEE